MIDESAFTEPVKRTRRSRKPKIIPDVVDVNAPNVDAEQPKRTRTTKAMKQEANKDILVSTLESLRQALEIMSNNHRLVPRQDEAALMFPPLAGIISRHTKIPAAPNPDIIDGITLAVAVFGPYLQRVRSTQKESAPTPPTNLWEPQTFTSTEAPVFPESDNGYNPESAAEYAAQASEHSPRAPGMAPYMSA